MITIAPFLRRTDPMCDSNNKPLRIYRIIFCACFLLLSHALLAEKSNKEKYEYVASQLSESYFKNISLEQYDLAYDSIAPSMKNYVTEQYFINSKRKFRSISGEIISLNISKLTVYENPVNAPTPGTYVAVDYYNEYTGVPVHCGYLVWFMGEDQEEFKIVREETGYITKNLSLIHI